MNNLTSPTMAELARQRLLTTQLILYFPAVAFTLIQSFEVAILVDLVGLAELPVLAFSVALSSLFSLYLKTGSSGYWPMGAKARGWGLEIGVDG